MVPTKFPQELEDEILQRVPPFSLNRFRAVCKRWNTLFNGKLFVKNHLACVPPQFILRTRTDHQIYSIGLNRDDTLEVRKLNLESPCPNKKLELYRNLFYCDGFLLCPALPDEVAIWNPWLRQQTRWIEPKRKRFTLYGLGYDYLRPENGYKIFGFGLHYSVSLCESETTVMSRVAIYEFATDMWKDLKLGLIDWHIRSPLTVVSLNGTLYWIAMKVEGSECFIQSFDFSEERFKPFCGLPCKDDFGDTQILAVFKGDRFSVLEQCLKTKKVEIWVTNKELISGDCGEDVSWKKFMTVSIPNFPSLQNNRDSVSQPSYFIDNNDDKRLIVCTCDEVGKPCIYIVKGDRFNKIQMDFVVDTWPYHLVYVPSLVPIPSAQIEQQE